MMILCFHELGNGNEYCTPLLDFRKIISINPDDEIHFDDGRKGIMALQQAYLKELADRLTIFIVPNFVKNMAPEYEKYSEFLNFEDIEKLITYGIEIGSHSLTHCDLTKLGITQLRHELKFSKKWLEDRFSIKVNKFSYPYGRVNSAVHLEASPVYKFCYSLDNILGIQRKLILNP